MKSEFLSLDISQPSINKIISSKLPPVPSDSSLSSDAGFESNPEKDGSGSESLKENKNFVEENIKISTKQKNSPQFFVGKRITKSDRQLNACNKCIGNKYNNNNINRPILRERVDRALAFMRVGGADCSNCSIQLKNPSRGLTGSKLLERRRSKSITVGRAAEKVLNKSEEMERCPTSQN
uniref:Uncharacterized protein n=1 Tax=Meloidogyne javanica TaxID=6303 RepID=A0A915MD83_MELJA